MQLLNAQYVNDVFTGEVKGNKTWEPDSFCACKVVVYAPTCGLSCFNEGTYNKMMSSVYIGLLASLPTYTSHKQRSRQRLHLS